MLDKLRHIKRKLLPSFAILAAMLTGCINDDSLCPDDPDIDPGEGITIEFTMLTRNAASSLSSRALVALEGNTEVGFAAENYLDLDNLTFLLFDKDQKMLRTFKPEVTNIPDPTTGEYVKYSVRAFLHDNYFLKATTDNIKFTIVVLGNYANLSPERFNYHIGEDLETIFASDKVGTFAAPTSNNSGSSWIPSIFPGTDNGQQAGHIPMAGMQTFTVKVADLRASTPDNPYQLSVEGTNDNLINILRALAKIEIVDKIGFTEGVYASSRSKIDKVEMVGHSLHGSILPTFDQWNKYGFLETQYVTKASAPVAFGYVGTTPTDGNKGVIIADNSYGPVLNFFKDSDATTREQGANVFSCYLTEYDPTQLGTTPPMWMRLSVKSADDATSTDTEPKYFRLEAAPYSNNTPGAVMPLLRNEIYRYVITGINADASLKLIVEDWIPEVTNWEYTDNPAMADNGYMKWWRNDVEIFADRSTARLVISRDEPVLGTFTFGEPKNSRWVARFANETEAGAFKFIVGTNADGSYILSDEASGEINGEQASIRIVATEPPRTDGVNRTARLIFNVETPAPDSRVLTADVVGDYYGQNQYFTIVQNAN